MSRVYLVMVGLAVLLGLLGGRLLAGCENGTGTPTITVTATGTAVPPTVTATASPTPTRTATVSPTPTPPESPLISPTPPESPLISPTPPESPLPTPVPGGWCGLYHVHPEDLGAVSVTGSNVVMVALQRSDGPALWRERAAAFVDGGVRVVLRLWPLPWVWDEGSGQWDFGVGASEFLALVDELWVSGDLVAVNVHEEPLEAGITTAQLQRLYEQIREHTGAAVYIPFERLDVWAWQDPARVIAPGVCDYCAPHFFPFQDDGYQRGEFIERLEAEAAFLAEHAPGSRLGWAVQTFEVPGAYRMPSVEELVDAYQIVAGYGEAVGLLFYFPFQRTSSRYSDWLANHPELWGVVCGGEW